MRYFYIISEKAIRDRIASYGDDGCVAICNDYTSFIDPEHGIAGINLSMFQLCGTFHVYHTRHGGLPRYDIKGWRWLPWMVKIVDI